jgi:hypothetical protein
MTELMEMKDQANLFTLTPTASTPRKVKPIGAIHFKKVEVDAGTGCSSTSNYSVLSVKRVNLCLP